MTTALADLPLIASGKVREIYDMGDSLLLVASDRISTYDVIHPTPIPDKGAVLTGLTKFWFEQIGDLVPGHVESVTDGVPDEVRGRGMVVKKLKMLPVECVVRGYITGSGWKDYLATGSVSGIELPEGLRESDKLPEPLFTPSTKAEVSNRANEATSSQNDMLFMRGKAMSGAPIMIGTNQLPKPPIIAGITMKKIMIRPCEVTNTL